MTYHDEPLQEKMNRLTDKLYDSMGHTTTSTKRLSSFFSIVVCFFGFCFFFTILLCSGDGVEWVEGRNKGMGS